MATSCLIGKLQPNGSVRAIYCASDGYLSHVGKLLTEFYNTPEKVDELISMGDIGSLGQEIGEKHDHTKHTLSRINDPSIISYTSFLHRDYERPLNIATYPNEENYYAQGGKNYLFKDGDSGLDWYYLFMPTDDDEETDEAVEPVKAGLLRPERF